MKEREREREREGERRRENLSSVILPQGLG